MKKRLTKKKKETLKQRDIELLEQCVKLSPRAMKDKDLDEFERLIKILLDILTRDVNGENSLLPLIHTAYFNIPLNADDFSFSDKKLKIERRNAMRGCAEILKLKPLLSPNEKEDILNAALDDIQRRIKVVCEIYFLFKAERLGLTEENKRRKEDSKRRTKQLMEKDRIVLLVNKLKNIGYTETKACKTVEQLLKFTKHPEHLTWQAIRMRYRRA